MTDLSSKKHLWASVSLAMAGCALWLATQGFRQSHHGPLLIDETLGVSWRRVLYSTLDEKDVVPDLFPPKLNDYIGFVCVTMGLLLAAGAGIGGGGILIPIFILIFQFPVKYAVPLSSVTVLGGSLANNLLNLRKSHPDHPSRPIIDWDLIIQLEPMTIAGALIGADLNNFLPDYATVILLFLLLSATAYKTLQKANKLHDKETEDMEELQMESLKLLANGMPPDLDLAQQHNSGVRSSYGSVATRRPGTELPLKPKPSFGADKTLQVWISASQLTGLFVVVTIINLLKGGPGNTGGGIKACGASCFWVTELGIMLLITGFASWMRYGVLRRIEDGGPVLSEIEWDEHNTLLYPMYAIVAGLAAGMFGVGGGIVKGPLMLALGKQAAAF
jgi:uncharacterized membrane protein YfcA